MPPGRRSPTRTASKISSLPKAITILVAGAGVFGRHHLRVYRELQQAGYPIRLLAVIDPSPAAAAQASADFNIPSFPSVHAAIAALGPPTAASICVPTAHHAAVAIPLLQASVHCLIEKPLAATLEQADEILHVARQRGVLVQPGHLERFNPAVTAARAHLHHPMFFEAHRLSVFTPRSLDVDVVLDLMIHDLDIVLSLVDSPVCELRAVGLPVLSRKVDIANVRVEFKSGCVANFTASRVSTERVRKLRFFQPQQYLSLDFARQDLLLIDVRAVAGMDPAQIDALASAMAQNPGNTGHPSPGLSLSKVPVIPGEPLRLEIESFLNSVRTEAAPVVTGEDGRRALALALEVTAAMAEHAQRSGLQT